jgi:alkanesulfonate monooxygenase SsuD/methylene tetrahydromethanopterin reductase-like flavin-dependent oxidoreductase (luciferase family)
MAVEVGLGVFSGEWHPGTGLDHAATLAESIGQVAYAETVGLDSVWVSEHHFHEANFVGSLAAYSAAMIQATSRIAVGYGLAIAPLHDPVRLAEDAAFLDVLSGGRFVLGMAIGYRPVEYAGFGTRQGERVGRLEEAIAICRQAWGPGEVEHQGTHFTRRGFAVTPKPVQAGGPGIMLGGHHPNAIDRAARLGDRFCMDAGTDSESYESGAGRNRALARRVEVTLERYREALRRHGHDDRHPAFSLNVGGFLHPDGVDAAWDTIEEAYLLTRRVYGDWYGLDPEEYGRWRPGRLSPEEVEQRKGELLLGTPDDVGGVLEEIRDLVGENFSLMFRSKYPLVDDTRTRQSIGLLAELRRRLR